ncbi:F0F1 ATP synthase subunit delta, partial [Helicobacter japonicus]
MLYIIAKKYTQALMDSGSDLDEALNVLKGFSLALRDKKIIDIIASPFLSKTQKEQFLLESVGQVDAKLQNFFR